MRSGAFSLVTLLCAFLPATLAKQKVLLYSRTAGYRHASIPDAIKAIEKLGKKHDFKTVSSEDASQFERKGWLNQFDALVFISVSGEALSKKGEVNMMKYIEDGGGYLGIHEACDALYHSPWYGRLVGAYFDYHPYLQSFTLDVQTHDHPSTSFLNKTWTVTDEVYSFNSNPRHLGKKVVLTVNPLSYKDPGGDSTKELASVQGAEHPIAWYKEANLLTEAASKAGGGVDDTSATPHNQRGTGGDGRAFYTSLGHTKSSWTDDIFLDHIHGALSWVLASPSIQSNNASLSSSAPGSAFIKSSISSSSGSTIAISAVAPSSSSSGNWSDVGFSSASTSSSSPGLAMLLSLSVLFTAAVLQP
ncbi:hypothetical protein CBS101457_004570 [Exobasidium rhododendri]|nr:hypothetical protein CBS101457_004570 [Exobasidium rhododendri]